MRFSDTRLALRKVACLLVAAALLLAPLYNLHLPSVKAFMPNDILALTLGSTDSASHEKITKTAVMQLYPEFFARQFPDTIGRGTLARAQSPALRRYRH